MGILSGAAQQCPLKLPLTIKFESGWAALSGVSRGSALKIEIAAARRLSKPKLRTFHSPAELRCDVIRTGAEISPDARQMIEAAASRAGMTVVEWLNAVILDAAADEGVKLARYVFKEPTKRKKADLTLLYSRLDDLAEKVELLAQTNLGQSSAEERSEQTASFDGLQHMTFGQLSELAHTTRVRPSTARTHRRMAASR